MKRTLIASVFLFSLVTAAVLLGSARTANATEVGYGRKFGLGFVLGDPTGLSAKLWIAPTNALDFGLGFWGYGWDDCAGNGPCHHWGSQNGTFNMDYLWQSNIVRGQAQLDWHIGAGGRALWFGGCGPNDCWGIGARMPVGIDLMFANPSFLEVFFEIAPILYFAPFVDFGLEGGLGVRFYF